MTAPRDPTAERLAVGLLLAFLLAYGWFDLLQGGIAIRGRSGAVSFADGGAGLAVAAFAFLVAALVSLLLAKSLRWGRAATWTLAAACALPPLAYVAASAG